VFNDQDVNISTLPWIRH